jgi:site-specific DNA-methyltransferase (adenine-specific)
VKLILADCRDALTEIPEGSVDAVVCDPPYELGFMGKRWDASGIAYQVEVWAECLRVLKPGGHLLAFGGSRTSHRLTCAIEDAGFQIRDSLMWIYGSG